MLSKSFLITFVSLIVAVAKTVTDYIPSDGCVGLVAMVSRSRNLLDAFAVGSDGRVYTAAWQPGDNGFRGWWKIGPTDPEVPPCSTVTAVSRSANKLDGHRWAGVHCCMGVQRWGKRMAGLVALCKYQGTARLTSWRGLALGQQTGCVRRWCGADRRVYTAAWEPSDGGNGFRGWWSVAGGSAKPGTPVGVVSRSANKLDVFITGLDNHVWTPAWEPSDGGNGFRGW